MKKKLLATVLGGCMVLSMMPASAFASQNPFIDVQETDWFYDSVQFAYENSLMSGTSEETFEPNATLTREMFVTILGRYAKADLSQYTELGFSDVEAGQWYTAYVDWAKKTGVTAGKDDGTFGVNEAVTREQMAVFIANFVNSNKITLAESANPVAGFNDIEDVSEWARTGLELMRKTGIIAGDDMGNFNPKAEATRSQAAAIFERLVKAEDKSSDEPGDFVKFGTYEQDGDLTNGKEAIEWIILEQKEGRAMLISRFALDANAYNAVNEDVTWETCSLRKWLNEEFYSEAFSSSEKDKIWITEVTADANPNSDIAPGKDTKDKVFLLSAKEALAYFETDEARKCIPTKFAVNCGGSQSDYYMLGDQGTCGWWLRSPGQFSFDGARINGDGTVGTSYAYDSENCVRPVIWIDYTA